MARARAGPKYFKMLRTHIITYLQKIFQNATHIYKYHGKTWIGKMEGWIFLCNFSFQEDFHKFPEISGVHGQAVQDSKTVTNIFRPECSMLHFPTINFHRFFSCDHWIPLLCCRLPKAPCGRFSCYFGIMWGPLDIVFSEVGTIPYQFRQMSYE